MLAQRAGQLVGMNYFYILQSNLDGECYYGSTTNLQKRLQEHQQGKVNATKYRRPLKLVYYEAYLTITSARKRERQVKTSGSARKTLHDRIDISGP